MHTESILTFLVSMQTKQPVRLHFRENPLTPGGIEKNKINNAINGGVPSANVDALA